MMARAHITPAPMAAPCSVRQMISESIDRASALPMAATMYAANPSKRIGRRPNRSDSGPHTSCDTPNASSKEVRVS